MHPCTPRMFISLHIINSFNNQMLMEEYKWVKPEHDISLQGSGKPFRCDNPLGSKLFLYLGEAWKLPVDAIVVGQNETFSERIDGNEAIFTLAGPTFEEHVAEVERVMTGSAAIVDAGTLGCKYVILAVGPRYEKQYIDASVHALHGAVRAALSVSRLYLQ